MIDRYTTANSVITAHRTLLLIRLGEQLAVQFDPKKPGRYHFSGAGSNYEKLEAILVMTVFALLAGYVLYTF